MKKLLFLFCFLSLNLLGQTKNCPSISFNIYAKDSLSKVLSCQKDSIFELKIFSKIPISTQNFEFQWLKNGEFIKNENSSTIKVQDVGYYTLQITDKFNKDCINISENYFSIYFPHNFEKENIDISYSTDEVGRVDVLSKNFSETEKLEWYRNDTLIGINQRSILKPFDGVYRTKRINQKCNIVYESQEVAIKDRLSVWVFKNDIGIRNHCEVLPILTTSFGNFPNRKDAQYQWFIDGKEIKDSTKNHLIVTKGGDYQVRVFLPTENKTYLSGKFQTNKYSNLQSLFIDKIEKICGKEALLKIDDAFMRAYKINEILWFYKDKPIENQKLPFFLAKEGGNYGISVKYFISENKPICTYNSFVNFEKKNDFNPNISIAYDGYSCGADSFKIYADFRQDIAYTWYRNGIRFDPSKSKYELFIYDKAKYRLEMTLPNGCKKISDEISLKGCTPDSISRFYLLNKPVIKADKLNLIEGESTLLKFDACKTAGYQWLKDGKVILNANQKNLEAKENGNYQLRVEKWGCVSISDSLKLTFEKVLSNTKEQIESGFSIFPNPTDDKIIVSLQLITLPKTEIILQEPSGKIIEKKILISENQTEFDISKLASGTYLITVEQANQKISKKIIKK